MQRVLFRISAVYFSSFDRNRIFRNSGWSCDGSEFECAYYWSLHSYSNHDFTAGWHIYVDSPTKVPGMAKNYNYRWVHSRIF
jgi:hypothetical protein